MIRRNLSRHFACLAAAALLGLALLGCSSDKDTASAKAEDGFGAQSGAAMASKGELDLVQAFGKMQALQSFLYDFAFKLSFATSGSKQMDAQKPVEAADAGANLLFSLLGDFHSEGAFRAPGDVDLKLTYAGRDSRFVQVGKQAWVNEAGSWRTMAPQDLGGAASLLDTMDGVLPAEPLSGAKTKLENVNGVRALHYSFDRAALSRLAIAGEEATGDATLDVWLNEDGVPVKLLLVAAGGEDPERKVTLRMELNLRNLNDKSIEIKAPV